MPQLDLTKEATEVDLRLGAPLALDDAERAAALSTWRGRMVNEHISARVFAALLGQMMAAGVSASKQAQVATMISDELRHGRLCAAVVLALGGEPRVALPALPAVPEHTDVAPLEGLLRNILSVSCLSETVAVALISADRAHAGPPELEEVLRSILADEVQHARFGWALLDELSATLGADAGLRARLSDYLAVAFAHLRAHELAHISPLPAPSAAAEAVGVCDGPEARQLFFDTVTEVIIPRLEALGLQAGDAWEASFALDA